MATADLFHQVMHSKAGDDEPITTEIHRPQYLYYSGELDRFGEWAFDDIEPFRELLRLRPERSSVNAWIGQPGVTAHCHFDGCVLRWAH